MVRPPPFCVLHLEFPMKVGQDDPGYDTYLAIKNAKDARVREKIEEDFNFEGAKIYAIDAASKTDIKRPYFRDATILEGAEFDGATIWGAVDFSNAIL